MSQNTYHHSEFQDLAKLVEQKQEQGLRISLAFPTLNEEATVGKEIVIIRAELMDRHQLIDEIAVIDSDSTDRTLEVARRFGAKTFLASECLPRLGKRRGKGENLWKSLYVLQGDIIVWLDADIKNIHPKFAYGLVGPLLQRPEISYVKAFYERHLTLENGRRAGGGGRVTEILVRPLFNLFYPDLASVIQPLSGEYAGRRNVLDAIPFSIGYGVETGMLIDIFQRHGLDAMAQVNLDRRDHRNQTTVALGRMAFGILQTFFRRLEQSGTLTSEQIMEQLPRLMHQIKVEGEQYTVHKYEIDEQERPPMITIDEYRKKWDRHE
ncbi:glucosyl-3-phosphoglycerate synthase [candidate division TA06 bacterium DG_24]|uniref:Glucosyl-3-phosphoglycerate synthase n=2 Tax=Bacteria division TA06 TaxID=1156500 RepID=A0A0S8G733_UNCT6|nr:MAG: glucosyl-3-phosphoglycerate synthase [candidate division TA06 bacterium DG_24]KPK67629.1 MAG: glucosyl-3-phosphoglycerate synthase [candidate division TA06 bacterium SM23_40]